MSYRPGPLLPRAGVVLCLLALLVPLLPELVYVLLLAWAALLGGAVAEAAWLARTHWTAERDRLTVLSLAQPDSLPLTVRGTMRDTVRVTLRQVWPRLVEPIESVAHAVIRPGEAWALDLGVRAVARGRQAFSDPTLAIHRVGLVERVCRLEAGGELAVFPDLKTVGRLHAQLNRYVLRGLGERVSPRVGKGRDFDRLREYREGDDWRDLAWRATARRGRLIVREYRLDRSQDVVVCLDVGHRMVARIGALTKLDHAVNAAVLLGYMCNRLEDRSGFVAFSTEVAFGVAPGRGPNHMRRLTAFVSSLRGGYVHSDYLALAAELRRRLRHRSLVVILTALPEMEQGALLRALRLISPQHLPLVVVFQDPDLEAAAELRPADKEELCRTLAAQDILRQRTRTIREARALGGLVVETHPGEAGAAAMNAYIDVKRRQVI